MQNQTRTKTQNIFITKLARMKTLSEKEQLTVDEQNEIQSIKFDLLNLIIGFGIKKARHRLSKYKIPCDAYDEIRQMLTLKFLETLHKYDPTISAPTTFFSPYFDEVITEYITRSILHISLYDANNIAKIEKRC